MPEQPNGASKPYRALVVHRRPREARRLLRVLEKLGCQAAFVRNALDAVRRYDGKKVDLIVMDADVESKAQEAAELLYNQIGAPVLYMCSETRPIGFHSMARGIGFLVPPLDPAYMQALLKRALRGPGMMA